MFLDYAKENWLNNKTISDKGFSFRQKNLGSLTTPSRAWI